MKVLKIFVVLLFLNNVRSTSCTAQNQFHSDVIQGYELQLSNITFDSTSGDVYSIPLRKYGLLKSNYSVIVSVTLKGDSTEYHIPGLVANHDQFSLILKNGRNHVGDTLKIIRKTGERPIIFSKIKMVAFRGITTRGILPYNKAFIQFVVNKYFQSSPPPLRLSATYYMSDNQ
ncbi:hypothetical protein [Dyadobacter sp. 3J3]|uniref:hypothetical protein n=1 Tax=Dyadobacter sp. 3J3 TaxID=2606600 RepID=UPI00135CD92C|nr:hypothetical protein [Dyadobacter sp. 3J3]